MKPLPAMAVTAAALALAASVIVAMLQLPPPTGTLPQAVAANLGASGVRHPVTAVLLNFRGYDTLLEVAVLLLAVLGVLALGGGEGEPDVTRRGEPVVTTMARLLVPLMVLTAGYLLWAGTQRPGGAFQAGAVLAAAAVLLHLARLLPGWRAPYLLLRLGLAGGFLLFLALAAAGLGEGRLLQYPPAWAGAWMVTIEVGLTVSLGLCLAGLFLLLTGRRGQRR